MGTISALDLFCGVGGLTHGLIKAGIKVHAGYDIDEGCRYGYEYNNDSEFCLEDISKLRGKDLATWYPKGHFRLLAGCAPCQPFSTYSQGRDPRRDRKWPLLYDFARLITEIRPELVTMENVCDVVKYKVYHDFIENLEDQGYFIWSDQVHCPMYGIPQVRTRQVLLASKLGPISFVKPRYKPNDYKTVEHAIGKLPPIAAGDQHPDDPLHKAASLSDLNMKRIRASKPGGSWHDWPKRLLADCHKKDTGRSYSGVYARMSWKEPSPTITTQCYGYGNGRFGHPKQHRAISLREAAILQTFPRNYRFVNPSNKIELTPIGRMIGNAVPVRLGKLIGSSIVKHVQEYAS